MGLSGEGRDASFHGLGSARFSVLPAMGKELALASGFLVGGLARPGGRDYAHRQAWRPRLHLACFQFGNVPNSLHALLLLAWPAPCPGRDRPLSPPSAQCRLQKRN